MASALRNADPAGLSVSGVTFTVSKSSAKQCQFPSLAIRALASAPLFGRKKNPWELPEMGAVWPQDFVADWGIPALEKKKTRRDWTTEIADECGYSAGSKGQASPERVN